MSSQRSSTRRIGKAGWFGVGALAATLAFLVLLVAGDVFRMIGSQAQADDQEPALVIEGK